MIKHNPAPNSSTRLSYQNRVLTAIAILLAVAITQRADLLPDTPEAGASTRGSVPSPPNAGAQRLKMIQELEKLDRRLDSIEKKLGSPLDVNVISMPEVKVAE
ncbi:MAG: hypothetical protein ACIAQF_13130 [Phycisphaerales bacterium JB065]